MAAAAPAEPFQRPFLGSLYRLFVVLCLMTASGLLLWPGLARNVLSSENFMPHGTCYMWRPWLIRLHFLSDFLIALAYYSIPLTLLYFARKKRDLPYRWMFLMFGAFIVACGTTHLMEIITLYTPVYWLSGSVKAITAALSVTTAIALIPLVPGALTLRTTAELETLNQQLEREIQERQRAEEILRAANKEMEAFSYSVSHDLRTPLRAIDGFSREILQDYAPQLGDRGQKDLQRIRAAAQRMGQLIDDLLNFSRLSRSDMILSPVNLSAHAQRIAEDLKTAHPQRQVEWIISPEVTVLGDSHLLLIVLENLLRNAWKFTEKCPQATIEFGSADREGRRVFFVRDNGVGFNMAYAGKLFGVFQRLHEDKDYAGTGVGLATVQRIIHRHGGAIWAESEENRGTVFYFTLPENRKDPL